LKKSYKGGPVHTGLDLRVDAGSIHAVLGPSGCGKTTMLKVITGLVRQDSGTVSIGDKALDGLPTRKRGIGMVFQNFSLFPHMSVRSNIEFGLRMKGTSSYERRERTERLMELMGISDLKERRPTGLSGGQRQRVAIARALAPEPGVLLLDEPFASVDHETRRRLRKELKKLQRELGTTMVFVTHDQEEAFEVGYLTAVMNRGRIEQIGRPRDLYEEPSTPFIQRFVGKANVIRDPYGRGGQVLFRPESVSLERSAGRSAPGTMGGTFANYIYLGPYIDCTVDLDSGETISSLISRAEFMDKGLRRGDRVNLTIKESRPYS
jgi:putative spermidine/putrescine transport system ATP-binding protein